jgi:hypothetical protein
VEQDSTNRALSGLLARLGGNRTSGAEPARAQPPAGVNGANAAAAGTEKSISTKAFSRFLSALKHRESPMLMDLGPVVGSNINYFGERLGCKFYIEDVYANVDKFNRENRGRELGEYFKTRFPQADGSFDGILCWDIFDYLDKVSAQVLARQMTRLLKPGGALLTFFQTVATPGNEYTRFLVVDDKTFKHKPHPAARGRQQVFVNRDINLMFEGLNVSDSFLLMTRTREIVFRKPEQKASSTDPSAGSEIEAPASTSPGSTPAVSSTSKSPQSSRAASASTSPTITTTATVSAMSAAPTTTATPVGSRVTMTAGAGRAPISSTS